MTRCSLILIAAAMAAASSHAAAPPADAELEAINVAELEAMSATSPLNSAQLTERYLARIDALDRHGPHLGAALEADPNALRAARQFDQERRASHVRGTLQGVPILLKDNIDTIGELHTTAGSFALMDSAPAQDAFIVRRLRAAGAVILGKTNLSEWANYRSKHASSGWSGRGGQTRNPYALDRNPCGASSGAGAAVAADFAVVAGGTGNDCS